ncbi:MAG: hypothetical protein ACPHOK_07795, partial [Akkermansiaceae bacterium]
GVGERPQEVCGEDARVTRVFLINGLRRFFTHEHVVSLRGEVGRAARNGVGRERERTPQSHVIE